MEEISNTISSLMDRIDNVVAHNLAIERDINDGERIEDYLLEKANQVSEAKTDLFWIACEMTHLLSCMREHNDKFLQACNDPQVSELWKTIETAMVMVK